MTTLSKVDGKAMQDKEQKRSEPLKQGFTTGAAAAAATKAALLYLINTTPVEKVDIRCLDDQWISIPIHSVKRLSEGVSCNRTEAVVIKDGGDDPDVTHKAEIGARVSLYNYRDDTDAIKIESLLFAKEIPIKIRGGEGVGTVTKPGLEVEPGNPAINSGPQKMIQEAIVSAFSGRERQLVDVEIFVPKGRELAERTLNGRLGILGGISILGTTGIVKPMSHDAYIATIRSGISVARAMGSNTLVFTTGRRSEKVAISLFPELPEDAFIQIGDFFKASLESAVSEMQLPASAANQNTDSYKNFTLYSSNKNIKTVIFVVFFGKAVKMAMGFPHTHAAKSELAMKTLAQWAETITCSEQLAKEILHANTARHAFTYIYPDFPELVSHIASRVVQSAYSFAGNHLKIRTILLDFDGNKIFDSDLHKSQQEIS